MIFKRRRSLLHREVLEASVDVHTHLLFGVDDGVKELSEALEALAYYESLGVCRVVCTPHINATSHDWALIDRNFQALCAAYKGAVKLRLAGEYMIDSGFAAQLELGLRPIEGDRVLLESSYLSKSANFEDALYEVMVRGYVPVVAHPERYLFMREEDYKQLKRCDYLFQLNLLSLGGCYGDRVRQRALRLLEQGSYDMVGSDMHSLTNLQQQLAKLKLTSKQEEQLRVLIHK